MSEINTAVAQPVARPPREWEFQTVALLAVTGCGALLGILLLVSELAIRSYLVTGGVDGLSPLTGWVAANGSSIGAVYLVLSLGYVFGFVAWRRATTAMLSAVGEPDPRVLRHWTIRVWYVSLFLPFVLIFPNRPATSDPLARAIADSPPQRMADALSWDATRLGIRLIGMAFLLVAVWEIRAQVRARVAAAGVALRSRDLAPRASAVPLPVAARPGPVEAGPAGRPLADDDFWRRVAALATGRRSEIAVLAAVGAVDRRWLLIPETGDLGVVRSTVPPGAVVTVYPEPPDAIATKGFSPRPADEYHGFLEDADSGAVRYESVKPHRVGAFLARARRSRRWALYPADSPEALTAVVPPGR